MSGIKLSSVCSILFSGLIIFLFSCQSSDERDRLSFQDPVGEVVDSLRTMRTFIWKISEYLNQESGYHIDKGRYYNSVFINGNRIASVDELRELLIEYSNAQRRGISHLNPDIQTSGLINDRILFRFYSLAFFLDDNYISSSYVDKYYNAVVFSYKDTLILNDHESRRIILIDDIKDTSLFFNEIKIFEKGEEIVLFSPYK